MTKSVNKIIQTQPEVDMDNWGRVLSSGFSIQSLNSMASGPGLIGISVDECGKVEIVGSCGKRHFLDLMSKLYDMAEVK